MSEEGEATMSTGPPSGRIGGLDELWHDLTRRPESGETIDHSHARLHELPLTEPYALA